MVKRLLDRLKGELLPLARNWLGRATERLDPTYQQLRNRYQKLERREKLLVRIAAGLLGLLALYNLIYLPIQGLRENLESRIRSRQAELLEVRKLMGVYARLKLDMAAAEKRTVPGGKDFSLFSVIEGTLTSTVGRDKIGSITPSDRKISRDLVQYRVELKLTGVSLGQIVDALYGVKTLPVPVTVTSLNIKRALQNPHSYDVEMTCASLGKNS